MPKVVIPIKRFSCFAVVCLLGCDQQRLAPPVVDLEVKAAIESSRFAVEIVGTFNDRLAYGGVRGIYILRNATTGEEWIGISGVGISALGSHRVDKTEHKDER